MSGGLARAAWPVEDAERFVEAVATAAGDDEPRTRVKKVDRTARKIADDRHATDWPALAKRVGDDTVKSVRQWLGIKGAVAAEPADPPWPDPTASEAFHGLPGRVVHVIGPASEADPTAILIQTLVKFGNVVGRGPHFVVEGDRHHANEYALLVPLRTSKARKGTSWGRSRRLGRGANKASYANKGYWRRGVSSLHSLFSQHYQERGVKTWDGSDHRDARRYFGGHAVSVRRCLVAVEEGHEQMFDGDAKAHLYERACR